MKYRLCASNEALLSRQDGHPRLRHHGTIALPITAVLLFWAVNDEETMGSHRNSRKLNAVNSLLVLLAVALGALSARSVLDALTSGGL